MCAEEEKKKDDEANKDKDANKEDKDDEPILQLLEYVPTSDNKEPDRYVIKIV